MRTKIACGYTKHCSLLFDVANAIDYYIHHVTTHTIKAIHLKKCRLKHNLRNIVQKGTIFEPQNGNITAHGHLFNKNFAKFRKLCVTLPTPFNSQIQKF